MKSHGSKLALTLAPTLFLTAAALADIAVTGVQTVDDTTTTNVIVSQPTPDGSGNQVVKAAAFESGTVSIGFAGFASNVIPSGSYVGSTMTPYSSNTDAAAIASQSISLIEDSSPCWLTSAYI